MPIYCPVTIRSLNAEAFEEIDYRIMGHAYASQNELGRLCEENVYEADLAARLRADGFQSVMTQVPLTIRHDDFGRSFFLDLVADDALYELKTALALHGEHQAQLLNYLFILNLARGKLLNFRPAKVEGRIVATGLNDAERRSFVIQAERWDDISPDCSRLRAKLNDLLRDWGAFLDLALYRDALIHFLGGSERVEQRVNLSRRGLALGTQRLFIHSPGVAFRLTAFTEGQASIEVHLRRLLALASLKAAQWINLNHARIELTTITA